MNLFKVGSMFLTKDEFRSYLEYKIEFFYIQIKSQAQRLGFEGRQREIHSLPPLYKRKYEGRLPNRSCFLCPFYIKIDLSEVIEVKNFYEHAQKGKSSHSFETRNYPLKFLYIINS